MFTVLVLPNGALTISPLAVGTLGFGSVLSGLPSPSKSPSITAKLAELEITLAQIKFD